MPQPEDPELQIPKDLSPNADRNECVEFIMQSFLTEIKLSERISDQEIELDRLREAYKFTASKLENHQEALQSVNEFYSGLEATLQAEINQIVEPENEIINAEFLENY